MDILERIRTDLGKAPFQRIEAVATEAGVSKWTLLKVARGARGNPRYPFLQSMDRYYVKRSAGVAV